MSVGNHHIILMLIYQFGDRGDKMDERKQKKIFKFIKVMLVIIFISSIVVIATYPVRNQKITLIIDAKQGIKQEVFSAEEIDGMSTFEIEYPGIQLADIKEIRISRLFKSLCVDKILSGSMYYYAEVLNDHVIFNENMVDSMKKMSKSFLMERLILTESMLAGILILWVIVNTIEEKVSQIKHDNHGPIKEIGRFLKDIKKYWQYMNYAARADLNAEVADSYLNRMWWLLEPFFNMIVYVIVFGKIMGNSIENYATFVFCALLMWNFFSKTINYSVKCIRGNRDIVTKVYVPKHVLLISNMMLNFYKLLFSMIVLIPMLFIFHVHIGMGVVWVIVSYALMLLFSFGIGMFLLHFGVYIDDLGYAVGILLQMLMFLSGVFYDVISGLSYPLNIIMLVLNPISMIIDTMRNALLYNRIANVPLIAIWIILSLIISYLGVHLVYKNENGYVKVV